MSTISVLQQLCFNLRAHFQSTDLIIAGGAPRDILSGVPYKDIDVFTAVDMEEYFGADTAFATSCRSFALSLGLEAKMIAGQAQYSNVFDLCEIEAPNGLIQIIGLQVQPIEDVPFYDFGLSQVFVTPTGLFATEAAWRDRANRTITYTPNHPSDSQVIRSKMRLDRLRAKYSDWQFVNCESLDQIQVPAELLAA